MAGSKRYPQSPIGLQHELKSRNGDLAQSTISKVLSEMERDQIILKSENELKLLQAKKLLDRLTEQYTPPSITEVFKFNDPDPIVWLSRQEKEFGIRMDKDPKLVSALGTFTIASDKPFHHKDIKRGASWFCGFPKGRLGWKCW